MSNSKDERKVVRCPSEFTWDLIEALPKAYYYHINNIPFEVQSKLELQPIYYFVDNLKKSAFTYEQQEPDIYDFDGPSYLQNDWFPPPLKDFYKVDTPFDKPVVAINNKYSREWDKAPRNYLTIEDLDLIFNELKDRYTIAYIRPEGREKSYFNDENIILHFPDFEYIEKNHPEVVTSRELTRIYPELSYNILQCVVLATADNHISVAGGNAVLSSYFARKNIVVCKCDVCISRKIWSSGSYLSKLAGSEVLGLSTIETIMDEIKSW